MHPKKKEHPEEKIRLHPRNKHRRRYDLESLSACCPDLAPYVRINDYGDQSVDFFDPGAVKMLNKALLQYYYDIVWWDVPEGYLCPPVPGRADYIHYIADLLGSGNSGVIPRGKNIKCLDVGMGSSAVYPIIGIKEYGWSFMCSDVDPKAIESVEKIIQSNPSLTGMIECRLQTNSNDAFKGIFYEKEHVDVTICNPPFHASYEDAQSATLRKLRNLKKEKVTRATLNFGGKNGELWCEGGELAFVRNMIRESKIYSNTCYWFSTLISKKTNLENVYKALKEVAAVEVKTIAMGQGNKTSRIVAWTFLTSEQQQTWVNSKWQTNSQ